MLDLEKKRYDLPVDAGIPDDIPKEDFEFVQRNEEIHDKKPETKPVGFFKDAMRRFAGNKSSVVAGIIILLLILYAALVPVIGANKYTTSLTDTTYLQYSKLLPKSKLPAFFKWDGCRNVTLSRENYLIYEAIGEETGICPITEVYRADYRDPSGNSDTTFYDVRLDSYTQNGMTFLTLNSEEYRDIQNYQNETGVQVIFPAVDTKKMKVESQKSNPNIWYSCTNKGVPKLTNDGKFTDSYKTSGTDDYDSIRVEGDKGEYRYAILSGTSEAKSYKVRVFAYNYFRYRYGFEPAFLFGTNAYGQDILTRLASGARFSLIFALCISAINLLIGAFYGAVEGYYGGATDMIMERITDILSEVPFLVVVSLFQLHLAKKVGTVPSLLFAFVLTDWIGMASLVRMQFYRYKNQEYILAARTMGAGDFRLMFRHIFPNAIGTIITGCVLTIPGVIYTESNMTYLGIVNLDSSTRTSVGSLVSGGQALLATYPHVVLFPALYISLLMISFNLFGNGLRDAFNPSLRGSED